jgi:hypothetical protein
MHRTLIAICLALAIDASHAEGFELKGIGLEATRTDVQAAGGNCPTGKPYCVMLNTTLAGVKGSVMYSIVDDRVKAITATFDSHDYVALRDAVIAKYGAAGKTEDSTIENRMGAKFAQQELFWTRGANLLRVKRFSGKITEGSVVIISESYLAQLVKQRAVDAQRNAKDL